MSSLTLLPPISGAPAEREKAWFARSRTDNIAVRSRWYRRAIPVLFSLTTAVSGSFNSILSRFT
jgi:hypothetical protein